MFPSLRMRRARRAVVAASLALTVGAAHGTAGGWAVGVHFENDLFAEKEFRCGARATGDRPFGSRG